MVIKTLLLLTSLLVLFLSPRSPPSSDAAASSSSSDNNNNNATGQQANNATSPVVDGWTRMRKHRLRSAQRILELREKSGGSVCCEKPVSKVLHLSKLIPMDSSKHYLIRNLRVLRCPSHYGCCASLMDTCSPTRQEQVSVEIPVEVPSSSSSSFSYVNETHFYHNHVTCGCKARSRQSLANYLAKEIVAHFNPDDSLEMATRVCRAIERRVRQVRRRFEAGGGGAGGGGGGGGGGDEGGGGESRRRKKRRRFGRSAVTC